MRKTEKKVPATPERTRKYVNVMAIRLAVRKHPNLQADIMKIVNQGDRLEVIGDTSGTWTKVNGGYVASEFVEPCE